jgi:hypothetical protein
VTRDKRRQVLHFAGLGHSFLVCHTFPSDNTVKPEVQKWLPEQEVSFYSRDLKNLIVRYEKCLWTNRGLASKEIRVLFLSQLTSNYLKNRDLLSDLHSCMLSVCSGVKIKWLIMFTEIIAVYYENRTKIINAQWRSYFFVKIEGKHIVTIATQRVKH